MRARALLALALLLSPPLVGLADASPGQREAILTFEQDADLGAAGEALAARGATVVETFDVAHAALVEAPRGANLEAVPGVAHVTPDEELTPHLSSSKEAVGMASAMREAGLTGEGVNVAIVDSGVDADHPGLEDSLVLQRTFSEDGVEEGASGASAHGSHVAGILVGSGEGAAPERDDVSGMAPEAGLVSLDISPQFTTSNALRAFEWLYEEHDEHDIRVVTSAWGRGRDPATYQPDDPLVRASDALVDEGVTVVFSAGNTGPAEANMTLEAANPNVLAVGAVDDGGDLESYSSRGPVYHENGTPVDWTKPDLVAPGAHVVSVRATPDGASNYVIKNGTSMAAPHVGGAAALVYSVRPDLTPQEVAGVLLEGADPIGGVNNETGHGMLDVAGAVEVLEQAGKRVEERSRSQNATGELTGPAEAGEQLGAASVDGEDAVTVTVPPNATSLEGDVSWSGKQALEVRVVAPDGRTARTLSVQDEARFTVAGPEEGDWRVEVSPEGADHGTYEANLDVTWLVEHGGLGIPVVRQGGVSGSFPSASGLEGAGADLLPGPTLVPIAAGAVVTAFVVVGTLRRRRDGTFEVVDRDEPAR